MPGYPYTSWIALIGTIVVIISMPFISGQGSGLIAGIIMTVLYAGIYFVMWITGREGESKGMERLHRRRLNADYSQEFSEELTEMKKGKNKKNVSCSLKDEFDDEDDDYFD
jgi:amino acid permease